MVSHLMGKKEKKNHLKLANCSKLCQVPVLTNPDFSSK